MNVRTFNIDVLQKEIASNNLITSKIYTNE